MWAYNRHSTCNDLRQCCVKESVRVALTLAALNDSDVKMADIENAYLTAPITEKVWTVLGSEFGGDAGKRALIVRALYDLNSAGAAFRIWMNA
jgi:hypothetical protein